MDIVNPEQRSRNMSAIRSQNTKPEIYFRKLLFAEGYRYSLNSNKIPGHPDIYLRKYNTAVFIHGCFWHQHEGCRYAYMPKSRVEFWKNKFEKNQKRDCLVQTTLKETGIKCLIIWECSIKRMKREEDFRNRVLACTESFLRSEELYAEI